VRRVVIDAEQRGDWDRDPDGGRPPVPGAERPMDLLAGGVAAAQMPDLKRGPAQLGQGVGAELVQSAGLLRVVLGASSGGIEGGPERGQVLCGHPNQAGGHPVGFGRRWADRASGPGLLVPFVRGRWVRGQHGFAGSSTQLRPGLLARLLEQFTFHRAA
jgi:hypothetical protein